MLLNSELIAVNQDPLGKGGNRIGHSDCKQGAKDCQIWAKILKGGAMAIALYNSVSTYTKVWCHCGLGEKNKVVFASVKHCTLPLILQGKEESEFVLPLSMLNMSRPVSFTDLWTKKTFELLVDS